MVNHIVLWNFVESLSASEKKEAGLEIKKRLEAVKEQVEGVISLRVATEGFESGNRDIALISQFETVEALNAYQVHPAHKEAGIYVRQVTCNRSCFDYEE